MTSDGILPTSLMYCPELLGIAEDDRRKRRTVLQPSPPQCPLGFSLLPMSTPAFWGRPFARSGIPWG